MACPPFHDFLKSKNEEQAEGSGSAGAYLGTEEPQTIKR
jgi:hypothetical protein